MIPANAWDIFLYYGGLIAIALLVLFRPRRKLQGMRLRLKGMGRRQAVEEAEHDNVVKIDGFSPVTKGFSHVQPAGERPLNVIFNYNAESWDAYEVLGLPAGSSPEKVEQAYRKALSSVDAGSRGFLQAAYQAIQAEWRNFKASGTR